MKIILFKTERTKNLTAIEIKPDGDVILSGKNGQGKSNILNVIMSVLTGQRLEDPIKHGEEDAECLIDVGDFKVLKKWTAKGEYIKVVMANGDVKAKPMEFLGGIIGDISFDPLEFARMKPKDQRDILKKLAGLDFSGIDDAYQDAFKDRAEVNVEIKGIIAQLQNAQAPDPRIPDEEISFKEELDKLQQLRDKRKNFLSMIETSNIKNKYIQINEEGIKTKENEIRTIQLDIENLKKHNVKLQDEINNLIVPSEVTENEIIAVEASLQDIEKKNVEIRAAIRYRKLIKESEKVKQEADAFTQKLNRLEQDKATQIANAPMPITGLSLGDESVMYNGEIFSNLSEGQKTKVSTAISMALNPLLKIIFIRRWADLDSEGKKELTDLAHEKGYDIWAEVVDESGELGYFIEDGEVKAIDGQEIQKPGKEE